MRSTEKERSLVLNRRLIRRHSRRRRVENDTTVEEFKKMVETMIEE